MCDATPNDLAPYEKEENTTPCDICTDGQLADAYCGVCNKKLCTEHEQVCRFTWSNITYTVCSFYMSIQFNSWELSLLISGTCSADDGDWKSLITREKLLVTG